MDTDVHQHFHGLETDGNNFGTPIVIEDGLIMAGRRWAAKRKDTKFGQYQWKLLVSFQCHPCRYGAGLIFSGDFAEFRLLTG
jgi:hypothetical protein